MSQANHQNPQWKKQEQSQPPLVLVVDDNPAVRDMIGWALKLAGYELAEAAEGQEALAWMEHATRAGKYPDVILLDLAMPGMDGRSFLQHLRSQWEPDRPLPSIVVMTAAPNGSDVRTLGVAEVIVKPFHVRALLDVVRQLTRPS
jgi:CheY-like chemotaxis protein